LGPLSHNVNHKNMIVMWRFLKGFAQDHGLHDGDINIFENLGLPYPKDKYKSALDYYIDPKQWSPLETYVDCYLKVKEITGDPNTFRNCGRSAAKYRSFSNWLDIAKTFSGPAAALNYLPQAWTTWNDTKILEIVQAPRYNLSERKIKAIFKYTFHPHIDPCDDYCSDPHILGLLEAIPTNWPKSIFTPWKKLNFGNVKQRLAQYNPVKLFSGKFFKQFNLEPVFRGNRLLLKSPPSHEYIEIGKKVRLLPSTINDDEIFMGEYEHMGKKTKGNDIIGVVIQKNLEIGGERICEAGVIMGAPYFLIEYTCDDVPVMRKIYDIKGILGKKEILLKELSDANLALRQEIDEKNNAYNKLEQYSLHLEDMIEKRTLQLKESQNKLVETEKRVLEHRITGGFAHEMRNALAGAQLEFEAALNYRKLGKSSTELIRDAAASLLKNFKNMQETYGIPKEEIAAKIIPEFVKINELTEHIRKTLLGVSNDIDRGLAITNLIREYAKTSEIKPGDEEVDVMTLLRSYERRYGEEFGKDGIRYVVEGPDTLIVKAEETHMNSIFDNLIRNARDALAEANVPSPEIRVKVEQDNVSKGLSIAVRDNGPGIPEEHLSKIFEPFFSTKPSSGTGLGLGVVKKLAQLYGGTIEVESQENKGALFRLILPEGDHG